MTGIAAFNLRRCPSFCPSSSSSSSSFSISSMPSVLRMRGLTVTRRRRTLPSTGFNLMYTYMYHVCKFRWQLYNSFFFLCLILCLQRYLHFLATTLRWVPTLKWMELLGKSSVMLHRALYLSSLFLVVVIFDAIRACSGEPLEMFVNPWRWSWRCRL